MADKRISQLVERTDIANNDVLPIVASGATTTNKVTVSTLQDWMQENLDVGVTSVGLSMPSAFTVSNSPVTTSGNITVSGAGTVSQYIRGDGSLADFPSISGGGSSVSYYLNGSVSQGTIGGIAYYEMNKVPILGSGTDFTINADGYIASFITDAGDPSLLEIPGGNWNFETYLQASSGGGSPSFYIELYKVNSGGTATLIASNSGSPELIAFGTTINPYFSALAVPTTTLALTDRLAIRYYVNHSGRTITLHTENNTLCQIVTTFTTGITALNGLTAQVQNLATGTSGSDFNISSASTTHTFNLPDASTSARGVVTTGAQNFAGNKSFQNTIFVNAGLRLDQNGTALPTFVQNISGTGLISSGSNGLGFNNSNNLYFSGSDKGGSVFAVNNTAVRTYTLQDANGTLAFTSDISSAVAGYLPLTGGTLTGPLNGTSATFTSGANITANSNAIGILMNGRSADNVSIIRFGANSGGGQYNTIQSTPNSLDIGSLGNTPITFGTNLSGGGATRMIISGSGAVTLSNLAGTGTRMVVADSNGVLSTAANPITGTGAQGRVAYWSGTGTITSDSLFQWNDTFKRLGIGRTPTVSLDVEGAGFFSTSMTAQQSNITADGAGVVLQGYVDNNLRIAVRGSGYNSGSRGGLLAATGDFSGQVTVSSNSGIIVGANSRAFIRQTVGGDAEVGASSGGTLSLFNNGSSALSFISTGAATFLSSVTANGSLNGVQGGTQNLLIDWSGSSQITTLTNTELFFGTNAQRRMTITSSGNVGIGTASDLIRRLVINGVASEGVLGLTSNNGVEVDMVGYGTGLSHPQARIKMDDAGFFGGNLSFWTKPNGSQTGALVDRMRITSAGNVGIGTPSPTSIGSYRSLTLNGTDGSIIDLRFNSNDNGRIYSSSEAAVGIESLSTTLPLVFKTQNGSGSTERMRITSGGYLKASNDGSYQGSTSSFHELRNTTNNPSAYISNTKTSGTEEIVRLKYTAFTPNNSSNWFIYADDPTAARFYVTSNGGIGNFQANDVNLSDERTKKDVKPLESYWDKFKAIEIVKFKYIDQTHDDFNIGVIAQQVEAIAPEFVDVDGWNKPELDEEGNEIVSEEEPLKSIYTADLYHATIKVLQEAMAKIEKLEAEIDSLKTK